MFVEVYLNSGGFIPLICFGQETAMPFETNNHIETPGKADLSSPSSKLWHGLLEVRM